jgi:hypothetical protein
VRLIRNNVLNEIVMQVYSRNIIEYFSIEQEEGRARTMQPCGRDRQAARDNLQGCAECNTL